MDRNVTMNVVKKLGWQLYLTNPYEHMYEKLEDMPKANYLNQVKIIFYLISCSQKKKLFCNCLNTELTFLKFNS